MGRRSIKIQLSLSSQDPLCWVRWLKVPGGTRRCQVWWECLSILTLPCRETLNRRVESIMKCLPVLCSSWPVLGMFPLSPSDVLLVGQSLCVDFWPHPSLPPEAHIFFLVAGKEAFLCFWILCPEAFLSFHKSWWAFSNETSLGKQLIFMVPYKIWQYITISMWWWRYYFCSRG